MYQKGGTCTFRMTDQSQIKKFRPIERGVDVVFGLLGDGINGMMRASRKRRG
jgi:hypothetical protein